MELNEQIKKYRTEMNISQEELAEKIYVTRQSISNWENGKTYPDIHSLLLLSSLFGISLEDLGEDTIAVLYPKLGNFAEQYNKMAFRNLDSETLDYLNTLWENLKIN